MRYPELVTYNWTMNNQLKQTHKKLMGSDEEAYKIPESTELISQLLLLIEAGDYEDLERMASIDYANARMSVSLKTIGSKKSVELINEVQPELERIIAPLKNRYPSLKITVTGRVGAVSYTHLTLPTIYSV